MGVDLWLRSVGLKNPFGDEGSEGSEPSRSSRGSAATRSRASSRRDSIGGNNGNGGLNDFQDTNDVMVPPEDSPLRKGTLFTSSTALALTLAGSCAVEAPYAFQKCGLLWGTILFGILAFSTERSLQMLCICARKTGRNSYGTLSRSACGGYRAHWKTNLLEIGLLFLLVAHYLSLLRRVLELAMESYQDSTTPVLTAPWFLLICVLVLILPLSFSNQYYTLGYTWSIGLTSMAMFSASVFMLAVIHFYQHDGILVHKHDSTMSSANQDNHDTLNIFSSPRSLWDIVEGFQMLLIGFLAAFNILSIQSALEDPTRERMAAVVHRGVLTGSVLTYFVGVAGYLCVGAHVATLSCPDADFLKCIKYSAENTQEGPFLFLYRVVHTTCCLSIILALPLVVTPCRHSILELAESIYTERQCPEISDCQEDCETCGTRASTAVSDNSQNPSNALVVVDERTGEVVNENTNLLPSIEENPTYDLLSNPYAQGLSTLGILVLAYLCAVFAGLVEDFYVWVGPFVVYIFSFIMPSLHFFALQRPNRPASTDPEKKSFRLFARCLVFLCIGGMTFSMFDIVYNLEQNR